LKIKNKKWERKKKRIVLQEKFKNEIGKIKTVGKENGRKILKKKDEKEF
jgi:hypothetical protein